MSTNNKFIEVMDTDEDVIHIRKSAISAVAILRDSSVKLRLDVDSWVHSTLEEADVPKLLEDLNND